MQIHLCDLLLVLLASALGLLAHTAKKNKHLEFALRAFIACAGLAGIFLFFLPEKSIHYDVWLISLPVLSILLLFAPVRNAISVLLSGLDSIITGRAFFARDYLLKKRIFLPDSFPHLMAAFIYIGAAFCLLLRMNPASFKQATMILPSVPIDRVLHYNGLELVLLSFCGIGICVARSYKVSLTRLALVKPAWWQIYIGIALILLTLAYDANWAIHISRHVEGQDLATYFAHYRIGVFDTSLGFISSVAIVMISAILFAVGEEMLFRGAMQPVFGIIPTALLSGLLYGQFALAPIFMVKVFIWSVFVGLIRSYTNTTTTLIGHAGLNLLTIILFAMDP